VNSAFDALPPEIQKLINPKWRQNELEYWRQREQLLAQFKDRWIGFADGKVVASGKNPTAVFHEAKQNSEAPYVTCVGHEDEPTRIRRMTFTYDTGYNGEPLPMMSVEMRTISGVPGVMIHDMIADTGADATTITWGDSQKLNLDPDEGTPIWLTCVAGGRIATVMYEMWAYLDGEEHPCSLHIDTVGGNRLLGRDVMNRMVVTFDGPRGEVVVNP
jgi:hypothetical protein